MLIGRDRVTCALPIMLYLFQATMADMRSAVHVIIKTLIIIRKKDDFYRQFLKLLMISILVVKILSIEWNVDCSLCDWPI